MSISGSDLYQFYIRQKRQFCEHEKCIYDILQHSLVKVHISSTSDAFYQHNFYNCPWICSIAIFKYLSSYIHTSIKNTICVKPHVTCGAVYEMYTLCSSPRNPGRYFERKWVLHFYVLIARGGEYNIFGSLIGYRLRGTLKLRFDSWFEFLLKCRGSNGD